MAYRSKFKGKEIDDRLDLVKELSEEIKDKQDNIEDLEDIRAGASKGATALQTIPEEYVTETELERKSYATVTQVNEKQDAILDLDTIRANSEKGATALQEIPSEYITESELNNKGFLTQHQDISHLATKSELTSKLNNKVDKVNDKQLSTEDFTTALKSKLESLSNYDDKALKEAVNKINNDLNTLVEGGATSAIESFNEIISFLEGVKDTEDLASIISSIEQQIANKIEKGTLSKVATSGSYNDLNDKPTIPPTVTESTVSGWGFTKNTGTYSKPASGIPKTDLASDVQTSLGKADTALQSYTEQYQGTVTGVKINGSTKNPSNGVVDLGNVITEHQDIAGIEGEITVNKLAQMLSLPSEDNTNPLATVQDLESKTDIIASQIFLEFQSDFDDFQVFSHKRGYEEHNREVCQRLIENCFTDKMPNNEVFFVTINGSRDRVPYMETAILESQGQELVRASFVKGNINQSIPFAASIGILGIDTEALRSYVESGEDAFYWKYISTQVPSIDAIGSEGESDVYVTEFTFEEITTNGTTIRVSPELVNAIHNKRIIVIPGRVGNYIATNTFSNPPLTTVNLRMQIATGIYIYDVALSAKGPAPQTAQTVVRVTNLLSGTLSTINGISLTKGGDMQLVSSISLNGKTYTPTYGAVDLGNIEGGGETNTMVSTSWGRLVSARYSGELIPGTYYRIIDYVTTTTQENTDSAGNLFDVIVLALDEHTLSEEAYAIQSKRDTDGYFGNSNLSAWKLWYCLDNDTSRFAWADETSGTGVIYRMIDEFDNDCPYDFKNILFTRYELEAPDEYEATSNDTEWMVQLATNVRAMFDIKAPSFVWAGLQLGAYPWEYEFGEVFSQATSERKMFYTFSDITDFENKEITSDASLMASTYNNKIGYSKEGIVMSLPNNVFFGADCYDNSFGNNCVNNSFGNSSSYNTFSHNCYSNTFGEYCFGNKLYHDCSYIIFSNFCYYNTFGISSYCNSFGESCYLNVFGIDSYGNSFNFNCRNNTLGSGFIFNRFLNDCCFNSFGDSCQINILSAECNYNNFGNECLGNRFGMGYFYRYNTFGEGVQYIHLTNDEQGYYDNAVQNYSIAKGIQGTYEEPLEINAERNRIYETTITRNSNGEIVQFCEGDNGRGKNIQLLEDPTIGVLEPNKIYVYATYTLSSITINSFSTTDALTEEYVVQFRTFSAVGDITLPSGVMWANGVIPTLEGNTLYELSIVKTHIGETDYFKAVLTAFK